MPEPHEPQAHEDGVAPAARAPHEIEPAPSAISPALPWHSWTAWRRWMFRAVAIVALWQVLIVAAHVTEGLKTPIRLSIVASMIRRKSIRADFLLCPFIVLWLVMVASLVRACRPTPFERHRLFLAVVAWPGLIALIGLVGLAMRPVALWHWLTLRGSNVDYTIAALVIGPALWMLHARRALGAVWAVERDRQRTRQSQRENARRQRCRDRARCQACNYNLAGLPASSVCPECGTDQTG
jgi:hypothetical protein